MHHSKDETAAVRQSVRRYYWTFGPAMVMYVLGTMLLFVAEGRSSATQLAMAAVPILGVIWVTVALVGLYRRSDELMRVHMMKGAAVGFVFGLPALAVSALVFSFLDEPPGRPSMIALWIPFMVGMLAWSIGWSRARHGAS